MLAAASETSTPFYTATRWYTPVCWALSLLRWPLKAPSYDSIPSRVVHGVPGCRHTRLCLESTMCYNPCLFPSQFFLQACQQCHSLPFPLPTEHRVSSAHKQSSCNDQDLPVPLVEYTTLPCTNTDSTRRQGTYNAALRRPVPRPKRRPSSNKARLIFTGPQPHSHTRPRGQTLQRHACLPRG